MSQRKKPHYSLEFKRDAAQLIISKGYTYPEATSSLGVSASALRKWVTAEKSQTLTKSNTVCLQITYAYEPAFSVAKTASSNAMYLAMRYSQRTDSIVQNLCTRIGSDT